MITRIAPQGGLSGGTKGLCRILAGLFPKSTSCLTHEKAGRDQRTNKVRLNVIEQI
jgi:hypothetical protein